MYFSKTNIVYLIIFLVGFVCVYTYVNIASDCVTEISTTEWVDDEGVKHMISSSQRECDIF